MTDFVKQLNPAELTAAKGIFMLQLPIKLDSKETLSYFKMNGRNSGGKVTALRSLDATTADGRNAGLNGDPYKHAKQINSQNNKLQAVLLLSDLKDLTSVQFTVYTKQQVTTANPNGTKIKYNTSCVEIQVVDIRKNAAKFPVTHAPTLKNQADGDGVIIDTIQGLMPSTKHIVQVTAWVADHDMSQKDQSDATGQRSEKYDMTTLAQQTFTTEITSDANGDLEFVLGKETDLKNMNPKLKNSLWLNADAELLKSIVNQSCMGEVAKSFPGAGAMLCVTACAEIGSDKARVEGEEKCLSIQQALDCPEHVLVRKDQLEQTGVRQLTVKLSDTQLKADTNNLDRARKGSYRLGYVVKVSQKSPPLKKDIEIDSQTTGAKPGLHEQVLSIPDVFEEDKDISLEFLAAMVKTTPDGTLKFDICPSNGPTGKGITNTVTGKLSRALSGSDMTSLTQTVNSKDITGATDNLRVELQTDLVDRVELTDVRNSVTTGYKKAEEFNVDTTTEDLREFRLRYTAAGDGKSGHFAMAARPTTSLAAGAYAGYTGSIRQVVAFDQLTAHLKGELACSNTLEIKLKDGKTSPTERAGLTTEVTVTDLDGNKLREPLGNDFTVNIGNMYQSLGVTQVATGGDGNHANAAVRQSNVTNEERIALIGAYWFEKPTVKYGNDDQNIGAGGDRPKMPVAFDTNSGNSAKLSALITRSVTPISTGHTNNKVTLRGVELGKAAWADSTALPGRVWMTVEYKLGQELKSGTKARVVKEDSPSFHYALIGNMRVTKLEQTDKSVTAGKTGFADIKTVEVTAQFQAADKTWKNLEKELGDINFRHFYHTTVDDVTASDDAKNGRSQYSTASSYISGATGGKVPTKAAELDKVLQAVVHANVGGSSLGATVTTLCGNTVRIGNQGTSRWSLASKGLLTTAVRGTTQTALDAKGKFAVTNKLMYVTTKTPTDKHDAEYKLYIDRTEGGASVHIPVGGTNYKGDAAIYSAGSPTLKELVTCTKTFEYGKIATTVEIILAAKDTNNYYHPGTFSRFSEAVVVGIAKSVTRDSKHVDIGLNNPGGDRDSAYSKNTDNFTVDDDGMNNDEICYSTSDSGTVSDSTQNLRNGMMAIHGNNALTRTSKSSQINSVGREVSLCARLCYNDDTFDAGDDLLRVSDKVCASNDFEDIDKFIILKGAENNMVVSNVGNGDVSFSQALISGGSSDTADWAAKKDKQANTQRFQMSKVGSEGFLTVLQANVANDVAKMTWYDWRKTVEKYFTSTQVCFEAMPDGTGKHYTDLKGKPMTIKYHHNCGKRCITFVQDPDPKLEKVVLSGSGKTRDLVVHMTPGYNGPDSTTVKATASGSQIDSRTTVALLDMNAHRGSYRKTGNAGNSVASAENLKVWASRKTTNADTSGNPDTTPDDAVTQADNRKFEVKKVYVHNGSVTLMVLLMGGKGSGYEFGTLTLSAGDGSSNTTFTGADLQNAFTKYNGGDRSVLGN